MKLGALFFVFGGDRVGWKFLTMICILLNNKNNLYDKKINH